ncbi:MAG: SMP-30/gluconolactonase/LRE family protein [Planctomycetes bacterium]|nr:SMP-30/gluconolactonase/LRE family protein [Planctomycetota bacterium]
MLRIYCIGLAIAVAAIAPASAADPAKKTLGTIQRVDPAFDKLVPKDAVIEMLEENKFMWSEGPVWIKEDKALLFSDIPRNMIWRWKEGEGLKEYLKPSGYTGKDDFTGKEPGCNGLAINKEGLLVLCQHGDRKISTTDLKKPGKFTPLAEKYMGKRLNSPNDLVYKSNGDLYFTDPPYGLPKLMDDPNKELKFQGVYRLSPKGELTLLTEEMTRPNGIAFSPDEKTLYVANSDPEKAYWKKFPVNADGTIGKGEVFFDTTESVKKKVPGLPDGMKVDKDGNVWATGPGGVWVFNKEGKHLGTLATGVPTANCGWGDDGTVLYITADKNLVRVKTTTKGLGW